MEFLMDCATTDARSGAGATRGRHARQGRPSLIRKVLIGGRVNGIRSVAGQSRAGPQLWRYLRCLGEIVAGIIVEAGGEAGWGQNTRSVRGHPRRDGVRRSSSRRVVLYLRDSRAGCI